MGFVKNWNGHRCEHVYQLLTALKTVDNGRSQIITPIYTTVYQNAADVPEKDAYLNTVHNEKEIPIIIKENTYINIELSQSMPNMNGYRLDSTNPNDYSLLRVVNGREQEPLMYEEDKEIKWYDYKRDCGKHVFFPKNSTIIFVVNARRNCIVYVKKLKTVNIAMRLDVDVADFYNDIGTTTFLYKMRGLLGIDISRIKIVGIRKGSTIVDFMIKPKEEKVIDDGDDNGGNNNSNEEDETIIEDNSNNKSTETLMKENEELNNLKALFDQKLESGEIDMGAEILDVETDVVIPLDPNEKFDSFCRYIKTNDYSLIDSSNKDNIARSNKQKFQDIPCTECENDQDCDSLLINACKLNPNLLGRVECQDIITKAENGDSINDNVDNFVGKFHITFSYIVLSLLLFLK